MTDQPAILPAPAASLPRANMLAYLATASTPTRVRQVASRALRMIAFLHLAFATLIFIILACTAVKIAWREYHECLRLFATPLTLRELLAEVSHQMPDGLAVLFFVVASTTLATVMWACAGPVRRGRKLPARFAVLTLLPDFLLLFALAFGAFTFSLSKGFGLIDPPANPGGLLMFFPAAVAIVLILLLKDLAVYLLWIARHPITEKPPTKFLPETAPPPTIPDLWHITGTQAPDSQSPSALPSAAILNYLTPAHTVTPTRVRQVAFWTQLALASFALASSAACFWITRIRYKLMFPYGNPWPISTRWFWRQLWRNFEQDTVNALVPFSASLASIILLLSAAVLLAFLLAVRRGRRIPCHFSAVAAALLALIYLLNSALIASLALLDLLTPLHGIRHWSNLAFLPLALVLAFLALLAKDLIAYLRWIARTPLTEKPPIKFLP